MEKSESIKHWAAALSTFQMKAEKISKDASNPFFKSKYASLSHIQDSIQIPLAEAGLVYTQLPDGDNIITLLIHPESGEYVSSSLSIDAVPEYHKEKDRNGNITWRGEYYVSPQAKGSAITYAKRYALAAMLGLNIDEDDDGNAGSGKQAEKQTSKELPWLNDNTKEYEGALKKLKAGTTTIEKIKTVMRISGTTEEKLRNALNA